MKFGSKLAISSLLFTISALSPSYAEEVALDALAPGNIANCSSPINGLYGNTIIAGATTTISKLEFITQSYRSAPANSIRVKISTGAPMSTSGTLVGTFSQSSVASSPVDGGDKYLITFTGTANVVQGTTYYIQPSYVSSNADQSLCLSSNSYTALSGWSLPMSGSNYIDVWSTGTFNWYAYHKMRITIGEVITAATFSTFQLPGNVKTATYGSTTTLTANVAAPSKVTFFANNKRIANCIKVSTSGTSPNISATCNWKPSQRGSVTVTAQSFPNDSSISSAQSTVLNILIKSRTTLR